MNKEADITAPIQAYKRTIGSRPLLESAVLGTTGALAGYYGTPLVSRFLINKLMAFKSPQEREALINEFNNSKDAEGNRRLLAGALGVAGMALPLQNMDFSSGFGNALKSGVDSDYYKKNPHITGRRADAAREKSTQGSYKSLSRYFQSGRKPFMQKQHSLGFQDNFAAERVPISYSMDLINGDPFLTLPEKEFTNVLLEGAESSSSGMVSGKDLASSAIRSGVGFGAAYAFGSGVGKVLALPTPVTKRLSLIGGIAGAVLNSGIFEDVEQ
jgi:hypothetical protein